MSSGGIHLEGIQHKIMKIMFEGVAKENLSLC